MSYAYIDFKGPSQRPGAIQSALFVGTDDDLNLEVKIFDGTGLIQKTVTFPTTNATRKGWICVPNSFTVQDLDDETCVAHLRMAGLIADVPIGSTEWNAAILEGSAQNLQTAIGVVKVFAVRVLDQLNVEIDLRKNGTSSPTKTLAGTKDQFPVRAQYSVEPETQARCIAGAIEKQFSTYVHNHPSQVLSTSQKTDIETYVATQMPPLWI